MRYGAYDLASRIEATRRKHLADLGGIRGTSVAVAICVGAFAQAPGAVLARQPQEAGAATAGSRAKAEQPTHATRGIVKSIDSTTMTLSRPRNRGDITFKLSPGTHTAGKIVVGATVSVRYRDEGSVHIATAVTVQDKDGQSSNAAQPARGDPRGRRPTVRTDCANPISGRSTMPAGESWSRWLNAPRPPLYG